MSLSKKDNVMASKYNPKRIIQLLQICSWKNQSTLNFNGFGDLAKVITKHEVNIVLADKASVDIKQKYLNELLLDAQKNLDSEQLIGRNEFNIRKILYFINFQDWKSFDSKMKVIESCLDWSKIDFSTFKTLSTAVFCDEKSRQELEQQINYISKSYAIPIQLEVTSEHKTDQILSKISDQLKETPFILWCISDELNDALNSNPDLLQKQFSSGQIIPIRIGNTLHESDLTLNFIDFPQTVSGLIGLLMALAVIDMTLKMKGQSISNSETVFGAKNNMTIQNNSGTIFSGDNLQIKGENVALRDFIQQVNPKKED